MIVDLAWAKKLGDEKSFVLHTETGVIGRVKRFWSGTEGDRYNDSPGFSYAIIELENGHTLVAANEDVFVPLTEAEAKFFDIATAVLTHTIKETIQLAASSRGKIALPSATTIVEAALMAQLRLLQAKK